MEELPKPKVYVEKFRDGRLPIYHNHPFKPSLGKRPRPPGPLRRLVSRKEWQGKPPEYGYDLKPLSLPVTHIRYFSTNTEQCINFKQCSTFLQDLQWEQMKNGFPDIEFNFYVARDGAVYEGRGWNFVSERSGEEDDLPQAKYVDIAFTGDYLNKRLPKIMSNAALDLIDWGVYHFKVKCCHDILYLKTNVIKRENKKTKNVPPVEDMQFV